MVGIVPVATAGANHGEVIAGQARSHDPLWERACPAMSQNGTATVSWLYTLVPLPT